MVGARARGGGILVRASRVRLGIPRFQLRVVVLSARFGFGGVATKRLSLSLSRRRRRRRFAQLSARRLELRGEMIGARARGGGVLGRAVPARFGFGGVATKRLSLSLSRRRRRRRFAQLSARRLELRGEMVGVRARGGGVFHRAVCLRLGVHRLRPRA